jgi:hypothetical protein
MIQSLSLQVEYTGVSSLERRLNTCLETNVQSGIGKAKVGTKAKARTRAKAET